MAASPAVLRRFIRLTAIATALVAAAALAISVFDAPPGDYQVRKGDIHLSAGEYEAALADFDAALAVAPGHRGALMGRAIALLQAGRLDEAEHAFTDLLGSAATDQTERALRAVAHANLGILYDRLERHRDALAQYRQALALDAAAVAGPGVIHRILYDPLPSSVADRAAYLAAQFALPDGERRFTEPAADARQRMHRP